MFLTQAWTKHVLRDSFSHRTDEFFKFYIDRNHVSKFYKSDCHTHILKSNWGEATGSLW